MPRFCAACGVIDGGQRDCVSGVGKRRRDAGGGAAAAPAVLGGESPADNVAAGISYIIVILAIIFLLVEPYRSK